MKLAAAHAIASCVGRRELGPEYIIPSVFNKHGGAGGGPRGGARRPEDRRGPRAAAAPTRPTWV